MGMIVINKDVNASPAAYRQYTSQGVLLVTNIFYTIQGEGPYAGRPCVFLRLAGCNIGEKIDCPWCDTQFSFARGKELNFNDVRRQLTATRNGATLIVVTGGEPLLQWTVLKQLMESMTDDGLTWQFETNGLLLKADILADARSAPYHTHFVVSPKVPANHGRYRPLPADWWTAQQGLSIKYVVEADETSAYHMPGPVGPFATYVSGMAVYRRAALPGEVASIWDQTLVDRSATARNYRHAARVVLEGKTLYRLSLQTHLFVGVE
jgi:organic radical activating enzyme